MSWMRRRRGGAPRAGEARPGSRAPGRCAPEDYEAEIGRLIDSRRAIVRAYEVERRRIERDLHDGAQQHLVAAAMQVGEARLDVPDDAPGLAALLEQAQASIERSLAALRATVRGIHPQVLADAGLAAALEDAIDHGAQDVTLMCPRTLPELPEGVLACAYFFVMECLANAAKHAPGAHVSVLVTVGEALGISVVDDGPGGARVVPGHGLEGIGERLSAFGGAVTVASPPGGPTRIAAEVPLLLHRGEPAVVLPGEGRR
ncbi:sensor histidine kinase [Corynebacterium sp.]|uniref:sensor histidine kinase n=1 Tax=Corynebacterium sp. TaxID=1720 RepID=UPI0026DBB4F1|nr:histidine kinase [Corynebacterium sp.]MDO4609748.1 histidine kinase [Corynebacterium sp.]